MPYHIRLTPKKDRSHDEVKLDLSQEELDERVLRPYRMGNPITLLGRSYLESAVVVYERPEGP